MSWQHKMSLCAASNFGFHWTILPFFLFIFYICHAKIKAEQWCDQKKSPRFTARPTWTHSSVCSHHRRSGWHSPGLALTQTGTGLPAWGLAASKQCQTQLHNIAHEKETSEKTTAKIKTGTYLKAVQKSFYFKFHLY